MNYYPFNVGDYAAHTGHLEPMEDLAYRRLLDLYYLREGPLPSDVQVTAKLIRMRSMADDVEAVLREFFEPTEEGWYHGRCSEEIAHMQDKQAKARASGQASAKSRRASAEQKANDRSASVQEDSTDVQLPTPTPTPTPVVNKTQRAPRFDAQAHLVGLEVDPAIAADWIKLRKTKRAEVTATAIDGVSREAEKAGLSLDAALRECCSRGWAGFKADWMQARDSPGRVLQHQSVEQRNKAVAAAWVPPEMRGAA